MAISNVAGSVASSNAVLSIVAPQPPRFDLITLLPDERVDLLLRGATGSVCVLEASSNLLDWSSLATLTNTGGVFEFIDAPATNSQRAYRARLAP